MGEIQRQVVNANGDIDNNKLAKLYYSMQYRYLKLQEKMLALEAKNDLYKMALFIGFRDLYEPLHRSFARFLMDKRWKKKLWLMPRKHFKTSVGTIAYCVWRIVNNPKIKILIFSSKRDLAKGFLSGIKSVFENCPQFREYYGDFVGDKVWNKTEILVKPAEAGMIDNTFTIETAGVDGATTSKHYDLVIFDDIVSLKNYHSEELRQKTMEAYDEAVENLLKQDGEVVVLGTRWHFADQYSFILDEDNIDHGGDFKCIVRQAIEGYVGENIWTGKTIFPEKFTMEYYKRLSEKKEYLFWANYMNNPKVSKGKKFNPQALEVYFDDEVDWNRATEFSQITDIAAHTNTWNDRAAICQVCRFGKYVLVLDVFSAKMDTDDILKKNIELLQANPQFKVWYIEDAGQQAGTIAYAEKILKNAKRSGKIAQDVRIETVQPGNREKEQRIYQMAPYAKDGTYRFKAAGYNHRMEDGEQVDMMKRLAAEMDEFPLGKYVDMLDVLSYSLDVYDMYDYESFDASGEDVDFNVDKKSNEAYTSKKTDSFQELVERREREMRERDESNIIYDPETGEAIND